MFDAGTAFAGEQIVTSGGRVLCVTALGENVKQARDNAHEVCEAITFEGKQYRTDIGTKAI